MSAAMDIVDILDDSDAEEPTAEPTEPTAETLREAIRAYLVGKDLASISLKALRRELEVSLGANFEARREEIKALATEQVQAAQAAAQAPVAVEAALAAEPPGKRRKGLLAGAGEPAVVAAAAPAAPLFRAAVAAPAAEPQAAGKPVKRKMPPSAYSLWTNENRAKVAEDLTAELARKPTFGECCKAVADRWKAIADAERAIFEEKAQTAKANMDPAEAGGAAKVKKQQAPGGGGRASGKGGGKGRGRGSAQQASGGGSSVSRADFLGAGLVLECALQQPASGSRASLELAPRIFKSGGAGWFGSGRFTVLVNGQKVAVNAQVVLNASGSKHWDDGEGLDELRAKLEASAALKGGGTPDASQGGEAPDAPEAEVAAPPEIFLFQGSTQWAADWAEQETATEN
ncbi:unnamed protein product, partial [Polarella glacialis]